MSSILKIGPEDGPFVELDESTGDFIIRVPNDSVDFDVSDLENIGALNATSATIDGNSSPFATDPHDNTQHSETFLFDGENFDGLDTSQFENLLLLGVAELTGNLVNRAEGVTNIEGNQFIEPEGTDPDTILEDDGDIVFLHEE